jgi:hypothetical protein
MTWKIHSPDGGRRPGMTSRSPCPLRTDAEIRSDRGRWPGSLERPLLLNEVCQRVHGVLMGDAVLVRAARPGDCNTAQPTKFWATKPGASGKTVAEVHLRTSTAGPRPEPPQAFGCPRALQRMARHRHPGGSQRRYNGHSRTSDQRPEISSGFKSRLRSQRRTYGLFIGSSLRRSVRIPDGTPRRSATQQRKTN